MSGSVILIVVDGIEERAALGSAFSSTPLHLVFAVDGEDALERYPEVKPDLILASVRARRLDGATLCRRIRPLPRGSEVPLLLIAPEPELAAARVQAESSGADGVLATPFDPEEIAGRLAPILAFGRSAVPKARGTSITQIEGPVLPPEHADDSGDSTALHSMANLVDLLPAAQTEVTQTDDIGSAPDERSAATEDLGVLPDATAANLPAPTVESIDTDVGLRSPFAHRIPPAAPTRVESRLWDQAPEPGPQAPPETPGPQDESTGDSVLVHGVEEPAEPHSLSRDLARSSAGNLDLLEEPPHIGSDRGQLLEEPQISVVSLPNPPVHGESSEKRRLIQEPTLDRTPSGAVRASKSSELGGSARGLDESQLGKRLAKRVRAMFQLLETADHYGVLSIPENAGPEALRRAYFDLSLEFHPDRFFLLRAGDLKEKIYAIYRRIAEAYDTLSDSRRRQVYDELRRGNGTKEAPRDPAEERRRKDEGLGRGLDVVVRDPRAKKFVDLASAALSEGDFNSARLHIHLATAYETSNASLTTALETVIRMSKPAARTR